MALSENTEANIDSSQSDKDISDWIQISKRGIYSYDWSYTNNRYERLCSPVEPLSVEQLPDELRATANQIVIPDCFASMLFLPVTD